MRAVNSTLLHRLRVDHTDAARATARRVVEHLGDDAVRAKRELPRLPRRGQRRAQAVEVRMRHASALARTAVVTRKPPVVRLGENGGAADRHHALSAERLEDFRTRVLFDAGHRHRRKKVAVGKLLQPFVRAGDADEPLDVRVPRCDVFVTNRPVVAVAVLRVRLEVEVAPAIDLTSPRDRTPTHLASAEPSERRVGGRRVGVLRVIHKKLMAHFVARVAFSLHWVVPRELRSIAQSSKMHFPRLDVLDEILVGIDRPARLEHDGFETALRELLCGPPTADPRADDDRVEVRDLTHGNVPRHSAAP